MGLRPFVEEAPFCACGCGQKTLRDGRKRLFNKYVKDHHLPIINSRTGPANPLWRGHERISNGYVFVYAPGHHRATISSGTYTKRCYLIAEKILGRLLQPGEEVHHKNGDKTDDRPGNLEVLTKSEHMRHHLSQRPVRRGERASKAKLCAESVLAIRARYAAGESGPRLAREFKIADRSVYAIVNRETWTHI